VKELEEGPVEKVERVAVQLRSIRGRSAKKKTECGRLGATGLDSSENFSRRFNQPLGRGTETTLPLSGRGLLVKLSRLRWHS